MRTIIENFNDSTLETGLSLVWGGADLGDNNVLQFTGNGVPAGELKTSTETYKVGETYSYSFEITGALGPNTGNMIVSAGYVIGGTTFAAQHITFSISSTFPITVSGTFTPTLADFGGSPTASGHFSVAETGASTTGRAPLLDNLSVDVPCFARGTLITTQQGIVCVEDLAIGDHVLTMDNTYQPIRWIGRATLDAAALALKPKLRPVRIAAGALGNGLPSRDLIVSPQHRILARSIVAQRMFETSEILVPAIKLITLDGIEQMTDTTEVEYIHLMFDRHEIVFSNDAPTESLYLGKMALRALGAEAREEIVALFPHVAEDDFVPSAARFIPAKGKDVKHFVARLHKNGKDVLSEMR